MHRRRFLKLSNGVLNVEAITVAEWVDVPVPGQPGQVQQQKNLRVTIDGAHLQYSGRDAEVIQEALDAWDNCDPPEGPGA